MSKLNISLAFPTAFCACLCVRISEATQIFTVISLWNQANYVDLYVIHNPRAGRIKEREQKAIDSRVVGSRGVVMFMLNMQYRGWTPDIGL